jgi:hypothetical protein
MWKGFENELYWSVPEIYIKKYMCSVLDFKYILSNSNCILAVYVKNLVMYKHRSVSVIKYSFSNRQLSCCNFCDFKHQ